MLQAGGQSCSMHHADEVSPEQQRTGHGVCPQASRSIRSFLALVVIRSDRSDSDASKSLQHKRIGGGSFAKGNLTFENPKAHSAIPLAPRLWGIIFERQPDSVPFVNQIAPLFQIECFGERANDLAEEGFPSPPLYSAKTPDAASWACHFGCAPWRGMLRDWHRNCPER